MMFQESFLCSKQLWATVFFLKTSFFVIKCAPFIFKMGEDLILMIKKEKALKIGEIHLKTQLDAFASNVSLTQVIHFYVI